MTPSWVERTARICEVWSGGERSIREHFEAANPDLSNQRSFIEVVSSYLREHPDLCALAGLRRRQALVPKSLC
jgi:hypothetical protein